MSQGNSNPQIITVTVANTAQHGASYRNKPQSTATIAGAIVFISVGMNLAMSLGWAQLISTVGALHFFNSWFIGVIIGTIVAHFLRMFISKRWIMGAGSALIVISGLIFAITPFEMTPLIAARYLNGIATGLLTVTYLLYASELSVDVRRGSLVGLEQYSISCGVALQMIFTTYLTTFDGFPMNRLHGIFDCLFGVAGVLLLMLYIENPIDLIRQGDDAGAVEAMAKLQQPNGVSLETTAWLEQCKMYVREHESMTFETSMRLAGAPLLKMIFYRSAALAFCFSLPLNSALTYTMLIRLERWTPAVAGCCRLVGGLITILCMDRVRRKLPSILWLLCAGGFLLGIGAIFHSLSALLNPTSMRTASILCIVMQLFVGLFTPFASVLLAEAFPLRVKGLLMDVCVIVEQLLQIILINTVSVYMGNALIAQGVIVLITAVFAAFCIPETRGTSLSEAQRRFRNLLYTKME